MTTESDAAEVLSRYGTIGQSLRVLWHAVGVGLLVFTAFEIHACAASEQELQHACAAALGKFESVHTPEGIYLGQVCVFKLGS